MKRLLVMIAAGMALSLFAFDHTTCFSMSKLVRTAYPSGFNLADLTGFGVATSGLDANLLDIDPADGNFEPYSYYGEGEHPWPTWIFEADSSNVSMSLRAPCAGKFLLWMPTFYTGFNPAFMTWTVTGGSIVETSEYFAYVLIDVPSAGTVTLRGTKVAKTQLDDYLGRLSVFFFPASASSVYLVGNYSENAYPNKTAGEIESLMKANSPVRRAGGWVKGTGLYFPGSTATFTAVPVAGCAFDHWEVRTDNAVYQPEGIAALKAAIAGKERNMSLSFAVTEDMCVSKGRGMVPFVPMSVENPCAFLTLRAVWKAVSGAKTKVTNPAFAKSARLSRVLCGNTYSHGIEGTVDLKVGKMNSKGILKVSAKAKLLNGKSVSAKAVSVNVGPDVEFEVDLPFKSPIGTVRVCVCYDSATRTLHVGRPAGTGRYWIGDRMPGGNLAGANPRFALDVDLLSQKTPCIRDLLPEAEPIRVTDGKWKLAKGAKVSADAESGIRVDVSKGRTNKASLKLSYKVKTGLFKGSFRGYRLEQSRGRMKLVKTKFTVVGVVVDGVGMGVASSKKPQVSCEVGVR